MAIIYTKKATIDDLYKIMSIVKMQENYLKMIKFLNGKDVIRMKNDLKKI